MRYDIKVAGPGQKIISAFAADMNVDGKNDLVIVLKGDTDKKIEIKTIIQNEDKKFTSKKFKFFKKNFL